MTTDAFGGYGGIAKFNRDFLRSLCNNPDVTEVLAVPRRMPHPPEPLPPKLTYIVSGLNNKLSYVETLLSLCKKYRRIDIIYCAHIHLLSVAYLLKLFFNAKILLILHGVDAWHPTKSKLNNYLTGKVDAIITVSEITQARFVKWADINRERMFLLPNAIEVKDYGPGPKNTLLLEKYGLTGKVILMTLGRLSSEEKYKGFDEVMELLPELSKNIPDIAYLVVGDGDDRPRLEAKASALGVGDRMVITGFVPEPEKADHFRLADAFVMPGRGEGFGIVFLEAMACGIPVVGSAIDGSREALRDGTLGILVDPRNPSEIKAGILEALKRPRGIVPEGLDYFSFENFEKRCHSILREVAKLKEG